MDVVLEYAAHLVATVLDRLGAEGPGWRVLDAHYHHGLVVTGEPPPDALDPADVVLVRLCAPPRAARMVAAVYVSVHVPDQQAIRATADQLQDLALEAVGGPALPPCPGHRHPLVAREVDGVASWVCPHDEEHHREPILPDY